MTQTNYDSEFCGSLPINFINQIQPYGFLIVCDADLKIVQLSDNVMKFTGILAEDYIEKSLFDFLQTEDRSRFEQKCVKEKVGRSTINVTLNVSTGNHSNQFLVIINKRADHFLLEFEPYNTEKSKGFLEVYQQIRETASSIQQSVNMNESLQIVVEELKAFSGFDKVMIYKFDENWNGHVVAEAMEADMESYIGITFPASDIPKQARDLYLKNPYRLIPDINYAGSKLYPIINPAKTGFTDLSDCNLRGVVKVHLEYLNNMNIKCSMSTRILKDGKLWGLIACHHKTPKFLNYDECSVFELLSGIISTKLSTAELQFDLNKKEKMQALQAKIIEDIYSETILIHGLEKCSEELMTLLNCQGLTYVSESQTKSFGDCPKNSAISELVIWLQTKQISDLYFNSMLSGYYEDALSYSNVASGIIVFPIIPSKGEFVLCYRPEVKKTIEWGGNPNEAIQFTEDKKNYHPRHSFAVWREELKYHSLEFTNFEVNVAKDLQRIFLELRLKQLNK